MSRGGAVEIVEVPDGSRDGLEFILDESFEGLYLWHAKRTLRSIDVVRAAVTPEGEDAGLAMLKTLSEGPGYVYYVAVPPGHRRKGVGGRLLDDAIAYFAGRGAQEVYASVPEENEGSNALFSAKGFARVGESEVSGRYGRFRSFIMYREMMVVRGEVLLVRRVAAAPA
ncbi:MAG: GNAT family N-acetyltransferase [Nitrososphaerota archaeon]|nr:GNAT family N-acetyltransferase [Nitrososphaerota archaeon]